MRKRETFKKKSRLQILLNNLWAKPAAVAGLGLSKLKQFGEWLNVKTRIKTYGAFLRNALNHILSTMKNTFRKYKESWRTGRLHRFISPSFLILPRPIWAVGSMFLAAATIIALETLLFHLLLIVSNYILATSIIGLAMLGIAFGALVSFIFSRSGVLVSNSLACAGLFISIVISYITVINIHHYDFPWPLLLPFFFSSFIVSNIFAFGGNANILQFANCFGSGLGVLICVVFIPLLKSETTLILLLLIPCAIFLLGGLRTANLFLKLALVASACYFAYAVYNQFQQNMFFPEKIESMIFEKKLLTYLETNNSNPNWLFLNNVYKKEGSTYIFRGDEHDRLKVETLLSYLNQKNRFPLPGLDVFSQGRIIQDTLQIPALIFEGELKRLFTLRFRSDAGTHSDLVFLKRIYQKEGESYVFKGNDYDKVRARFLLAEYGIFPFYDLKIDMQRHGKLRANMKFFENNDRILLSEDNLVGRLEYTGNEDLQLMAINGVYLDSIDSFNGAYWDPRVPRCDFLNGAQAFIIGLSADGIIKSVKRLPQAKVAGVEMHPTIFRTMTENGPFATWAARPYDNAEVYLSEGRSFLQADPRKWDMIFLMNIHPEHGPLNTYSPENLATIEGIKLLFDKLTPRGIVVFEEIITNTRSELAFQKLLNTCKAALPADVDKTGCFYIFRWDFWAQTGVFRTLILRPTPFHLSELRELDYYFEKIKGKYPGVELVYRPGKKLNTDYERIISNTLPLLWERLPSSIPGHEYATKILAALKDPRDFDFMMSKYSFSSQSASLKSNVSEIEIAQLKNIFKKIGYPLGVDLTPATDDKPFPYSVWQEKNEIIDIIKNLCFLVIILALAITVLLASGHSAPTKVFLPAVIFTVLSGFAFMLIEIVLIQKFQVFLGNPNWTILVVLGGMLIASGLGSLVARFLPRLLVALASLLIPLVLLFYIHILDVFFGSCVQFPTDEKLLASFFFIFPIAFLMGMPFPSVIELVKLQAPAGFAALLFGISGAASTMASATGLYINVEQGFMQSFNVGIILYSFAFVFFIILMLVSLKKNKQK